jgi:orotate phosphoribosyltransferase
MTPTEVLDEFRDAGALLEGHFILSSGLHSSVFLQKMFIFMDPVRTERLCRALAERARAAFGPIDVVVSPAVGGIVPGYETARHLGARALFVERENGAFALRRGFAIRGRARAHGGGHRHHRPVVARMPRRHRRPPRARGRRRLPHRPLERRGGSRRSAVSLASLGHPELRADRLPPELACAPGEETGSRA